MKRGLASRVSNWLSANHPTLWALRIDIVLALSAIYVAMALGIIWSGAMIHGSFPLAELATPVTNTVILLVVLLAFLTFFVWIQATKRAAYRDVSPRMRGHPRILDLSVAGTALSLSTLVLSIYAGTLVRGDSLSYDLMEWAALLTLAFGLSLFFASFAYVAIKLSLRIALVLVIGFTFALVCLAWFQTFIPGKGTLLLVGLAYLCVVGWLFTSNAGARGRVLVAAALLPATQVSLLCIGSVAFDLVAGATPGELRFGTEILLGSNAVLSLLLMEAISRKMVRLRLLPS